MSDIGALYMKFLRYGFIGTALLVLTLAFQNCSDFGSKEFSVESYGATQQASTPTNVDVDGSVQFQSPLLEFSEWYTFGKTLVFFDATTGNGSPLRLNLVSGKDFSDQISLVNNASLDFNSYLSHAPMRALLDIEGQGYDVLLLENNGRSLMAIAVNTKGMSLRWKILFNERITLEEMQNIVIAQTLQGPELHIKNKKYTGINTSSPAEKLISNCPMSEHIENNVCVSNTRACTAAGGSGQRAWTGSQWGACQLHTCNQTGYVVVNGSCVVAPTCTATQHLVNNVCVSNTRACSVTGGTGAQTWNGSTWGACISTSCNTGFVLAGGRCMPISCGSGQHLNTATNTCIASTRSCSITGGTGTQSWNGSAWSSCVATSCNTGRVLRNGVCETVPTCNSGHHVNTATNTCISSIRSCTMVGGTGRETWNGSAWGICRPESCNAGYVRDGNTCRFQGCPATQHLENNTCVANTRNCSVTGGTGTQTWGGTSWRECAIQSCNAGYRRVGNACERITCSSGQHVEGNTCVSNVRGCNITGGQGEQTWNPTTGWQNVTCVAVSCNSNYRLDTSRNRCVWTFNNDNDR